MAAALMPKPTAMALLPPTPIAQAATPSPDYCPLCGHANQCAMERQLETGITQEPCWCTTATFSTDLLNSVAPQARNLACICARCAALHAHTNNSV